MKTASDILGFLSCMMLASLLAAVAATEASRVVRSSFKRKVKP